MITQINTFLNNILLFYKYVYGDTAKQLNAKIKICISELEFVFLSIQFRDVHTVTLHIAQLYLAGDLFFVFFALVK